MKRSTESKRSATSHWLRLAAVLGGGWFAFVVAIHSGWTRSRIAHQSTPLEAPALATNPPLRRLTQDSSENKTAIDFGPRDLPSRRLSGNERLQARDYGYEIIATLQRNGNFEPAAHYALAAKNEYRRDWIIAAFHAWGRSQPDRAMTAVLQISDTTARQTAFQSVLSGWAKAAPEEMAEASLRFPEGDEKIAALTKALRAWMAKDPWTAGDWILAHDRAIPVAEAFFRDDQR